MKGKVKAWFKGTAIALVFSLLAGPAGAAVEKNKPNPAEEGAKRAYQMAGQAAEDAANATANAARLAGEKVEDAARAAAQGVKKAAVKTVEAGEKVVEAVTQDKVQAGVTAGLVTGLPAGGIAYLAALSAGAANPAIAAGITAAAVGTYMGVRIAKNYEQTEENN